MVRQYIRSKRITKRITFSLAVLAGTLIIQNTCYAIVITDPTLNVVGSPTSISPGDTAQLQLQFSLSPSSGSSSTTVNDIYMTFQSGDGQTATQDYNSSFSIIGSTAFNYLQAFAYATAGNYVPDVTLQISGTDLVYIWQYELTGGYYQSCGLGCSYYVPVYSWVLHSYDTTSTPSASATTNLSVENIVTTQNATIPEPETFSLLSVGLTLIGWQRRNRRIENS